MLGAGRWAPFLKLSFYEMNLRIFSNTAEILHAALLRARSGRFSEEDTEGASSSLKRLRQIAAVHKEWREEVEHLDLELVGLPLFGSAGHSIHAERYQRALSRLDRWANTLSG